jgi:hypothetical protein
VGGLAGGKSAGTGTGEGLDSQSAGASRGLAWRFAVTVCGFRFLLLGFGTPVFVANYRYSAWTIAGFRLVLTILALGGHAFSEEQMI